MKNRALVLALVFAAVDPAAGTKPSGIEELRKAERVGLLAPATAEVMTAEVIPPTPNHYFNDYAGVISAETARELDARLEQFERDTSNQIVVAIFPKMQSDSSIEDYTVRLAQAWGVGQKGKDNGAVLFIFVQDRKMFLQVGYGLEGALPDALAKQIIENEIVPRFRTANYDRGVRAGVDAILAATRGEYESTGRTVSQWVSRNWGAIWGLLFFLVWAFFWIWFVVRRSITYSRQGKDRHWSYGGGGWSSGGGGWSSGGGGWSGGGGGGFSGGGGGFGGGGAGGGW